MKKYDAVYAHVENIGPNSYLLGVNYHRLGMSRDRMLRSYSRTAYGDAWFVELERGYNDSISGTVENAPKANIPQKDTIFIMNNLMRKLKDFEKSEVAYEESEGDNYFVPGQGSLTCITFSHKEKCLSFKVKFVEILHVDGSYGCHWSTDVDADFLKEANIFMSFKRMEHFNYNISDVTGFFKFTDCGYSVGQNHLHLNSVENKQYGRLPNSDVMAKLILAITEHFVKAYKLKNVKILTNKA